MRIERHTLDNGLRVVLHPDPTLPLATVNLWYHVGSKNERPGKTGLAHLFEHMLFEGSENVGDRQHFRYLQQVGGVANGSTSKDRTNYFETVPARHLDLALWLESDRMGFLLPALTAEKLENQRQVVMNERLQRVDNQPYGRAWERLSELLFPIPHPYHWPVIGTLEDIAGATLDDLESFFSTFYRPNNAVLTVAGDFDPPAALAAIERYFGPLPSGPPPPRPTPPSPAADANGHRVALGRAEVMVDRVQLPRVYIAYRAPAYGERDWIAADLLTTALAEGKSSPLYRELVYRRQIAQNVAANVYDYELPGVVVLVATARPGVAAAELEQALIAELDRLSVEPLAAEDVERARNRLQVALGSQLQSLDERADLLSQLTLYFDQPELIHSLVERYQSFTPDDLLRYAQRWLRSEDRVIVTVVPAEAGTAPQEKAA